MDRFWKYIPVLLLPVIASCASTSGIAKKDGGSVVLPVAAQAKADDTSEAQAGPPISTDLCSLTVPPNALRVRDDDRRDEYCNTGDLVGCTRNPAVPDLLFPVPGGALSSGFGRRRGVFHSGLDIRAEKGDAVLACSNGQVVFAGSRKGYRSYGLAVLLDHGNNVFTHYAHCSRILVRPGQTVRQGEPIALVGSTGRSTSPHLHLEVRVGSRLFNPYAYFSPRDLRKIEVARGFSRSPLGPVSSGRKLGLSRHNR